MLGAQVSWTLSLSLSRPALAQLTFPPKVDNQPGYFEIDNSGPTKVSGIMWHSVLRGVFRGPKITVPRARAMVLSLRKEQGEGGEAGEKAALK